MCLVSAKVDDDDPTRTAVRDVSHIATCIDANVIEIAVGERDSSVENDNLHDLIGIEVDLDQLRPARNGAG